MKKVLSVLLIVAMMCGVMCAVSAAETEFVPSINEKAAPELVQDENGNVGQLLDASGNVISYVPMNCLIITPVSQAEKSEDIPEEAKDALLNVYEALNDGSMKLPAEELDPNLSHDELVVRDLFDLSWDCSHNPSHEKMVEADGVKLQVTFKAKAAANDYFYVLTYKNDAWNPIVSVTNNGDGTVTCVFEHLCPVAFVYGEDTAVPPTGSQFNAEMMLWVSVMAVSAVALTTVVFTRRKKEQA